MKIIRGLILRFILLACILSSCIYFLGTTNLGLKFALGVTNLFIPGKISTEDLQGNIWQGFNSKKIIYQNQQQTIKVQTAKLKWHLVSAYPLKVGLDELSAQSITIQDYQQKITKLKLAGTLQKNLILTGQSYILLPQGAVKINFSAANQQINSKLILGTNHATINGPFVGPWHIKANLKNFGQLHESLQSIDSTMLIDASIKNLENATLEAKMSPGRYKLPPGSKPEEVIFQGLKVKSILKSEQLRINATAGLDKNTHGSLELALDKFKINEFDLNKQKVSGKIQLKMHSLKFLEGIYDLGAFAVNVQNPNGRLKTNIDIKGSLTNPELIGKVSLENAYVELPDLGLTIQPAKLDLTTDGKKWDMQGKITSNNGQALNINGQGQISPQATGKVTIDGNAVTTINTPEYKIKASPQLNLTFQDNTFSIDGNISIPEAKISPVSFANTVTLTSDAVFDENKPPNPLNLKVDIGLNIGEDVKVATYGINGKIAGAIRIQQRPKQSLDLDGKLKLIDGKYKYYGQQLNIDQGEVIFLGKQIDNPNIKVRATRKLSNSNAQNSGSNRLLDFSAANLDTTNFGRHTTVGVAVNGRIKSPKIKLYSNPSNLSQEDILALLLFGKRADQVGSSGGEILVKALTAMKVGSESKAIKMLKKYKKSLGVDLDVSSPTFRTVNNNIPRTQVSVGKSITRRVYLRYRDGLFQESVGVLTLTYLLNKYLSIRVSNSDIGNGIDITYSHSE